MILTFSFSSLGQASPFKHFYTASIDTNTTAPNPIGRRACVKELFLMYCPPRRHAITLACARSRSPVCEPSALRKYLYFCSNELCTFADSLILDVERGIFEYALWVDSRWEGALSFQNSKHLAMRRTALEMLSTVAVFVCICFGYGCNRAPQMRLVSTDTSRSGSSSASISSNALDSGRQGSTFLVRHSKGLRGTDEPAVYGLGHHDSLYCYDDFIIRAIWNGEIGDSILVFERHKRTDSEMLKVVVLDTPYYAPKLDWQWFDGAKGKYMFTDAGSGPVPRGLAAYDLVLRDTVFTSIRFDSPVLDTALSLSFSVSVPGEPTPETCPEMKKWAEYGLGAVFLERVTYHLRERKLVRSGEIRCSSLQ
jgi:hypothetical protein